MNYELIQKSTGRSYGIITDEKKRELEQDYYYPKLYHFVPVKDDPKVKKDVPKPKDVKEAKEKGTDDKGKAKNES